jgi:hypothetical protein
MVVRAIFGARLVEEACLELVLRILTGMITVGIVVKSKMQLVTLKSQRTSKGRLQLSQ